MQIGKFEIFIAWDGYFKLDGGAMFGVVPKPLWNRSEEADDRNRILLSMNPMVIKSNKDIYIVDTGIGDKFSGKIVEQLQLDRSNNLIKSLQELGIQKEDVTGVILTHLHFDHAGGNTYIDEDGAVKPTFPNAMYYIQKGEWDLAANPNERTRASYLPENFMPLREHKQLQFLHGNEEITRGIKVEVTGGHTEFHQIIHLESDGKKVCYLADIVPTTSHLKVPYVMGYDTHPLDTLEVKKRLIPQAIKEKWLVVFAHAPRMKAGYLEEGEKGAVLTPLDLNQEN